MTAGAKKHSILLVDDEPEILFSLKGLLRREFNLFTAESAEEALQILDEHPIHVIMTDQRMPDVTGAELMARVKVEYPDAIRMIFTGYADIKAVIEAINTGGLYRYITKPWDPDELIEVLREAAGEYDALVARRQFLADTRSYIESSRQLIGRLSTAEGPDDDSVQAVRRAGDLLLNELDGLQAVQPIGDFKKVNDEEA
ncbi:response regulator [Roseiconus nitratireducens]|nr:response regulator [Roseiconus nitratireducens]